MRQLKLPEKERKSRKDISAIRLSALLVGQLSLEKGW